MTVTHYNDCHIYYRGYLKIYVDMANRTAAWIVFAGIVFLRKENVYVLVSHILWVVDVHINGSDVDMIGAVCTI